MNLNKQYFTINDRLYKIIVDGQEYFFYEAEKDGSTVSKPSFSIHEKDISSKIFSKPNKHYIFISIKMNNGTQYLLKSAFSESIVKMIMKN